MIIDLNWLNCIDRRWVTVAGLVVDLGGAWLLASGLFLSKEEAIRLGVSRISGSTDEDNLRLPAVQDRLKQSRNAKLGVLALTLGFLLQIVGSWPR